MSRAPLSPRARSALLVAVFVVPPLAGIALVVTVDRTSPPVPYGVRAAAAGRVTAGTAGDGAAAGPVAVAGGPVADAGRPVAAPGAAGPAAAAAAVDPAAVQDRAGAPLPGRDPADQRQVSLAEAAARPVVRGSAGPPPAPAAAGAGLVPVTTPVDPADILPAPGQDHALSSGCSVGYGRPGAQCLPARAPGDVPVTCAFVVSLFPDGVAVTGKDVLRLDSDGDGIACDPDDAGAGHEH